MAAFPVHISVSAMLGAAYGAAGMYYYPQMDWGLVFLGAGITTFAGMLPDLDSDSGIPVREIFGMVATAATVLLIPRLGRFGFTLEQRLVLLFGVYLVVKYIVPEVFKRFTVHRGMFHSIPGMFIGGLSVFLLYHNPNLYQRAFLGLGCVLGFLSHLVLDEIYAVDLNGVIPRLNKAAGSALKFVSPSWPATLFTYTILFMLSGLVYLELGCDETYCPTEHLQHSVSDWTKIFKR